MESGMPKISVVVLAFTLTFGISTKVWAAGETENALWSGYKIVAMAAFPDGRIALTLQNDKSAIACLMNKPNYGSVSTEQCYAVK
jgi:hypothetical protein